jgi:hypothetical protein
MVNNKVIVQTDGSSFWSGELTLAEGNNALIVKSVNDLGNESDPVTISILLETSPPPTPGVTSPNLPVSNWSTSVSIQGTKDPGNNILLNGKEIVSYSSSTLWSYTYSPTMTTTLLLSSKNRIGNESAKTAITLNYQGPTPPTLIAPLDGIAVKNSLGTPKLLLSWISPGIISQFFNIQIATSPDFSTIILNANSNSNPYILDFSNPQTTLPFLPGVYYWRVGATDLGGNVFYSPSRKLIYGKIRGDFNGDGYADILVGAEKAAGSGEVRLFLGGPDPGGGTFVPSPTPYLTFKGENGDDLFGTAIASGDLNGDGYDDIIIGAYHNSAGGLHAGRVYIYFGGPNLHATPDLVLTGFSPGEQFGVSATSGQDINQDGYDDLLVGANLNSLNGAFSGRAYLFLGRPSLHSYPDLVFDGDSPGDHFGISVALTGDINGDGFPDILIGASGDGTSSHVGKVYLYYGEFEPGNQPNKVFSGNTPGDGFGRMVAGLRDVNGDGYDDFLIGAPFHPGPNGSTLEPEAGEAYLYLGGLNLNNQPDLRLRSPGTPRYKANFGFTATSVGDYPIRDCSSGNGCFLKKDGYADFVVGSYGQVTKIDSRTQAILASAGRAYLFRGDIDPTNILNLSSTLASGNDSSDELFSVSLSSPGDVNGDGFDDLLVGAMTADMGNGRVYYFSGNSLYNPTLCPACILFGIYNQEGFGFAVK